MKKVLVIGAVILALLLVIAAIAVPLVLSGSMSGVQTTVEIGDTMPGFSLLDYNGNTHTLKQYAGKIVVLIFCSHKCPFSRGIDQDLASLASRYSGDKVVFLGIDSHYDISAEEIRQYAVGSGLPQPILRDPGNHYADAAGALVTPDIFVIDKQGKLAYRGAFDNRMTPDGSGSRTYLADALDALTTEIPLNPTHVPAWGCTIKRVK